MGHITDLNEDHFRAQGVNRRRRRSPTSCLGTMTACGRSSRSFSTLSATVNCVDITGQGVARFHRLDAEGRAAFVLGGPQKGIRKGSNCDGHKSKAGAIALAAISVWDERNRAKTAITERAQPATKR